MTVTKAAAADKQRLLRLALRVDAVITGLNGLAYLALAVPLRELFGFPVALEIAVGVFLVVYGLAVWFVARPAAISRAGTGVIVALNALWAVASIVELALGALPDVTTIGAVWVVLQAVVVAAFAVLQYLGLRRAA